MLIAPEKICFGRWQLDAQRRTLLADGTPVALNGRAFDLLELLVARRGQAVTRDELIAHVWQDVTVGENNLTVQMSHLRKVLGDGSGMILTVPRGYKFAGEVEALPVPAGPANKGELPLAFSASSMPTHYATPAPRFAGWGFRAAASAAVLMVLLCGAALVWQQAPTAPRLSIAVLPFRSLGADTAQADLADALTDDLTTDLAHLPASTVIARESADVWRGKAATVQQIARSLRVRYVVEGSIMKEESQYHVNAQLIDADTGTHLWAARFEAPQGRLGDVRNAIVRKLATELGFQLDQIENARSFRDRPSNPDSLDMFFRARAILDRDTSLPGLSRAQHLLEHAITQEPNFGDALAELGAMLLTKVHDMDDPTPEHDYAESLEMIGRSLEIAPQNARALAAHGRALTLVGKWVEASYSAEAALKIEPSSVEAEAVLAKCAQAQGRLDDAINHIEAILRLTPNNGLNSSRYLTLGLIYLVKGHLSEGMQMLNQAGAGDIDAAPTEGMGRVEVTRLLIIAGTGLLDQAIAARNMYDAYRQKWQNRTVWRFAALFDKSYTEMPGFKHLMDSLEHAGMPRTADEHIIVATDQPSCPGTEFDLTPANLIGGDTIDTPTLFHRLKAQPKPLLIDVGRGVAEPPDAVLLDISKKIETASEFVLRIAQEHSPALLSEQVIVMGDGTYGCSAYLAAKHLVARGYHNVVWYRGGEEAWAASGHSFVDRRSQ